MSWKVVQLDFSTERREERGEEWRGWGREWEGGERSGGDGEGSGREGREETKMDCYNNNNLLHKKQVQM